ncbi:MAG TPA: VOC family protein [Micromonosporaceae bacterium]|nr:VOC family protein [Micromonosporaceae bacterium]
MAYTTAFPILHSDDPKRLMEFYTTVMGLPVTYRFPAEGDPEFITVGVGAATIGIGDYTTVDRMLGRVARGGHPFQLCVYTDDLDGDLERLRAAGAKVHMEPADQPWGERMGYVADPDGNLLMLAQKLPRRPQPEEPSAGE